jgi:L-iditol 2-dehydrogenase
LEYALKVAYFTAIREIKIADEPKPQLQRPHDVMLRMNILGVCGSDVHYYTHGRIGEQVLSYPFTIGHECSATVVEVGSAVKNLAPGDRVAVDPAFSCGRCDQCLGGRANTCRNIRFMGAPDQAPGASVEYYVLPAENCFRIPDSMSLEQAALVEPLTIGLYSVRLGQVFPGARMGVLGAGPIGLSVIMCAKAAGDCAIYASELLESRLAAAQRCGADWTANPRQCDIAAKIAELEPLGLDLVFECTGDPSCIDLGQRLLKPGGTLVMVGIPNDMQVSFDIHLMRRQELVFKNVRRQKGCIEPMIAMIQSGRIDPGRLLTHRFPLERIGEAFDTVAGYRDGVVKALVEMPT